MLLKFNILKTKEKQELEIPIGQEPIVPFGFLEDILPKTVWTDISIVRHETSRKYQMVGVWYGVEPECIIKPIRDALYGAGYEPALISAQFCGLYGPIHDYTDNEIKYIDKKDFKDIGILIVFIGQLLLIFFDSREFRYIPG